MTAAWYGVPTDRKQLVSLVKVRSQPEAGEFAPTPRPATFATTRETRAAQLFNSAANHLDNALFVMRRDYLEVRTRVAAGDALLRADAFNVFVEGYLTELEIAAESLRHAEELVRA